MAFLLALVADDLPLAISSLLWAVLSAIFVFPSYTGYSIQRIFDTPELSLYRSSCYSGLSVQRSTNLPEWSQKSEVRSQNSEVRSQMSEVGSQL
jgi:hypothetical protein